MGVPSYWYDVLIGLVIIASVAVAAVRGRAKGKRYIEVEEGAQ
jgi:ribose/xylose/arabinose/galactoside ABC-type transport system permease subunit